MPGQAQARTKPSVACAGCVTSSQARYVALSGTPDPSTWERVARLRPRVREHTAWHEHSYRGRPWFLLRDLATGRTYHFTAAARAFVVRLDGHTTVEEALRLAGGAQELATSQAIELLLRLQAADLLVLDGPADPEVLFTRWRTQRRKVRLATVMRPLAMRFPLFDPARILDAGLPLVRPLFGWAGLLAWLTLVAIAALLTLEHADGLIAHARSRFLDPLNLLALWLCYPVVKGLHEFGHAFAIRVWGGVVHEMGVMLLVFVPVPYVEASAATVFPEKSHRMVVGAAGIMVETALAALALLIWLNVQPGWVSDVAFNVTVIGGVSTLLFNGNPLLRFDGYYILADALEIPNLATRAQRYYAYLLQRYLLRLRDTVSPVYAPGEGLWFLLYGTASSLYRIFISCVIALYVAGKFFVIGSALALWVVLSQVLLPVGRWLKYLVSAPALAGHRGRALLVAAALSGVVLVPPAILPVPFNTVAEGVLLLPEDRIVRARGSGEVVAVQGRAGATVDAGQPLLQLRNEPLNTRYRSLQAKAAELRARTERDLFSDRVEAAIFRDQLAEIENELRDVERLVDDLQLRSPGAGVLELPRASDLPGRFVRQGDVLGVVRSIGGSTARVVVPHQDVEHVRKDTRRISARYVGVPGQTLPARLLAEVPAGTYRLPSRVLGSQAGGRIATDSRDAQGVTALQPVFHFDIELPALDVAYIPGARVLVRFEHTRESLGRRWYRSLRQLFLDRLGS